MTTPVQHWFKALEEKNLKKTQAQKKKQVQTQVEAPSRIYVFWVVIENFKDFCRTHIEFKKSEKIQGHLS